MSVFFSRTNLRALLGAAACGAFEPGSRPTLSVGAEGVRLDPRVPHPRHLNQRLIGLHPIRLNLPQKLAELGEGGFFKTISIEAGAPAIDSRWDASILASDILTKVNLLHQDNKAHLELEPKHFVFERVVGFGADQMLNVMPARVFYEYDDDMSTPKWFLPSFPGMSSDSLAPEALDYWFMKDAESGTWQEKTQGHIAESGTLQVVSKQDMFALDSWAVGSILLKSVVGSVFDAESDARLRVQETTNYELIWHYRQANSERRSRTQRGDSSPRKSISDKIREHGPMCQQFLTEDSDFHRSLIVGRMEAQTGLPFWAICGLFSDQDEDFVDLLFGSKGLLHPIPNRRMSCEAALKHRFVQGNRTPSDHSSTMMHKAAHKKEQKQITDFFPAAPAAAAMMHKAAHKKKQKKITDFLTVVEPAAKRAKTGTD